MQKHGRYRINVKPATLKPVEDYLRIQGRFRHLTPKNIETIQENTTAYWEKLNEKAKLFPAE